MEERAEQSQVLANRGQLWFGSVYVDEPDEDGTWPSDLDLWNRASMANPYPFGVLFLRHSDRLFRHCLARIDDRADAEDLVSATFVEAWRKRTEVVFKDADAVLPWLLAVANFQLRNKHRTLRRHRKLLRRMGPPPPEPDHSDEVAARIDALRDNVYINKAFGQLRSSEQEVLMLCLFSLSTPEDAAVALGLPTGTVKSRLARARARLRELTELEMAKDGKNPSMSTSKSAHEARS